MKIDSSWITVAALVVLVLWFVLVVRQIYAAFVTSKERLIALEAQRHMLRFCQHPTQRNWEAAWTFITENQISLNSLDWPLVERFTKTGYATDFPPNA